MLMDVAICALKREFFYLSKKASKEDRGPLIRCQMNSARKRRHIALLGKVEHLGHATLPHKKEMPKN